MNNQNKIFNKSISTPVGILIVVVAAFIAGGVIVWQQGWISDMGHVENIDFIPPAEKEGNPKLGSVLYQLTKATNYKEFGRQRDLYIVDNKVRVEIEFNGSDFSLPSEFGKEEARTGNLLQALVFIDKLSDLAGNPSINFIRTPFKVFPMGN